MITNRWVHLFILDPTSLSNALHVEKEAWSTSYSSVKDPITWPPEEKQNSKLLRPAN